MTAPGPSPRRTIAGIAGVWVLAAVLGIAVGLFAPAPDRAGWLAVALGVCIIAGFAVQLAAGRSQGFTQRAAAAGLGSLVVLGAVSLGFGLAMLLPV